MNTPKVVSRAEWLESRKALLTKEKELTRLRDGLAAERRALPWVKVDKQYVFDGPDGKVTLGDLFDGRSQLFVKHFMLGPGQVGQCVGCSLEVDHAEGALVHLQNHDVSYVVVARAPIGEIEAVRKRMGWKVRWGSWRPTAARRPPWPPGSPAAGSESRCPSSGPGSCPGAEKWTVAATAHHVASSYEAITRIIKTIASGQPLAHFTRDMLDEMNAQHARTFADCPKTETIALHRNGAAAAAAAVRGLSDTELAKTGAVFSGMPPITAEDMVKSALLGHIDEHFGSIRMTVGR
jgi:hypothetical protein